MAKIIVTGGCGFIGSNLVRRLLGDDHHVLNIDKLTYAGNADSLTDIAERSEYSFVQEDICDATAVPSAFGRFRPDAVMHLAAESHVDRSIDGPGEFVRTNVQGTFCMLQSALEYFRSLADAEQKAFRFLHVSTDEVYGSLGFEDTPFRETTPYDPHSPYSASKAASDHLARAWHTTYGLPVLVTNCSNNYGPYQFPEKLIPVVILKCLRGDKIPVYGKGENVRDWLHVDDHCRALIRVLESGVPGETYNVGGNNELSNLELVRHLCKILNELHPSDALTSYESLIEFVNDRPGHDLRYAIDATKIKNALGWQPLEDSETGFRKTVAWYLENREWWERILNGEYQLQRQGLQN